jgi:hypothetical protein
MTGTELVMLILLVVVGVGGLWFGCLMYRDGYRRGYSDGTWDEKYPEMADGPLFPGPNDELKGRRDPHRRQNFLSSPSR